MSLSFSITVVLSRSVRLRVGRSFPFEGHHYMTRASNPRGKMNTSFYLFGWLLYLITPEACLVGTLMNGLLSCR